MTWPMHDAGSTTPDPGRRGPPSGAARRAPPPGTWPWPEEPRQELAGRAGSGDAEARRGRHAAPDPLPPIDGPMPGGGPSPAETTLPLSLTWPAPPARPHRSPAPGPPGPPGGPAGWRRVPRTTGYAPPGPAQPRYPQPTFRPARPPDPAARRPGPGAPRRPPRGAGTQRSSLVRSSAGMAVGTLVSRGTGFLRTLVLVAAIGVSYLGNAYNNANTLPNTVYYLMLGGIFTSVVVPLLVRAAKRDPDHGEAYAQRMFTLGAVALLVVTVVATLLAEPLVNLYAGTIHGPAGSHLAAEHDLMVTWAYFFIPQIFFYGMSSLIGAILNTRGRFAAPMWTPVINNLIVIVVGGLYVVNAPGQGAVDHFGRRGAAARDRHHARRGGADRRAGPVAAGGRVPVASRARVPARRGDRDGPDGRLDVGLRGLPVGRLPHRPEGGERGLGRSERLFRVLHRVAAVPAPVRDHRHLGDHGAAAADERARQRPPVLAGQGRLLDRRPAGLGARGAGCDLPLRARRAARGVPDRLVPAARAPTTPGTSARSSACSPWAWCRTC